MDRSTLIIVLIVILIVLKMIGGSSEENFATLSCGKEYQNLSTGSISNHFTCPGQCPKLRERNKDGKITYICKK